MEVIYVLLPASLLFAVVAIVAFVRATRSGQFDDLETPALRVLGDDARATSPGDSDDEPPRG